VRWAPVYLWLKLSSTLSDLTPSSMYLPPEGLLKRSLNSLERCCAVITEPFMLKPRPENAMSPQGGMAPPRREFGTRDFGGSRDFGRQSGGMRPQQGGQGMNPHPSQPGLSSLDTCRPWLIFSANHEGARFFSSVLELLSDPFISTSSAIISPLKGILLGSFVPKGIHLPI